MISSSQEPPPTQNTANTRDKLPCPQQASNPRPRVVEIQHKRLEYYRRLDSSLISLDSANYYGKFGEPGVCTSNNTSSLVQASVSSFRKVGLLYIDWQVLHRGIVRAASQRYQNPKVHPPCSHSAPVNKIPKTVATEYKTDSTIPLSISLIFYPFFLFLLILPV